VLGFKDRLNSMKSICFLALLLCLVWGLFACEELKIGDRKSPNIQLVSANKLAGKLSETPPPKLIQQLGQNLEQYQPQVKILAPKADTISNDTSISVQLEVQGLPVFKDKELGIGPHLNLILDNQPYQTVYNVDEPIILDNLVPGSHTIRVFAARPWDESFKNEGAYAQTTFHILTKTNNNQPDPAISLLTYTTPNGTYGAEPIMLDFYLTNAPLHRIAEENPDDEIKDWHIRATINGESFLIDEWQPIYLKGFQRGKNWIQLELIDEEGNNIENAFNNTVRVVTYDPKNKDTLAKLVEEKIALDEVLAMVDPNYRVKAIPVPEVIETPVIEPAIKPPVIEPEVIESGKPNPAEDIEKLSSEPVKTEIPSPEIKPRAELVPEVPIIEEETAPEINQPEKIEPQTNIDEVSASVTETIDPDTKIIVEIKEPTLETVPTPEEATTTVKVEITNPTVVENKNELPQERKLKTPQWLKNFGSRLQQIKNDASQLLNKNSASQIKQESEAIGTTAEPIDTESIAQEAI
jgi:hypothetical protein